MVAIYISAGSNVRPIENLRLARKELERRYGQLQLSRVYRNAAIGFDGDEFLNAVIQLDSDQAPHEIRDNLEQIHQLAGRERGSSPFGPRTLDLDLLLYGDRIHKCALLELPRPDVLKYSFVLRPMAEMAPDLKHPVSGITMAAAWRAFDQRRHPLQLTDIEL